MKLDQSARAVPVLEKYTQGRPEEPEAHLWLARAHRDQGRTEQARRILEKIIEQHPDFEPARQALAEFQENLWSPESGAE